MFLFIGQKFNNPKSNIGGLNTINTFSVGCLIKFLKIKQNKAFRRSRGGLKIFLNFLKNIFFKKYHLKNSKLILTIRGFDFHLFFLKRFFFQFLEFGVDKNYFLLNLSVAFTKKKAKKIKAIKKRLKKRLVLDCFNENNKF